MIEYLALTFLVIFASALAQGLGIHSAWLVIPIVLGSIPSTYAFFTGAPHVPSDAATVRKMIDLAEIQPGESVVDLGSGDGRLLRAAQARGAAAVGYELSLYLYLYSRLRGSHVYYQNFWAADLQNVDVVFCYLLPKSMLRFEREIWPRLKPGCRVIASTFPLPGVEPAAFSGNAYRYDRIIRPQAENAPGERNPIPLAGAAAAGVQGKPNPPHPSQSPAVDR